MDGPRDRNRSSWLGHRGVHRQHARARRDDGRTQEALMARARFIVRGLVPGVNFRATAVREASRLSLTGRVWNRPDGTVGIVAEGDVELVAAFNPRHGGVDVRR